MNKILAGSIEGQQLLQSGRSYTITSVKREAQIHPQARELVKLLKNEYPEIALNSSSSNEFVGKLFDSLKGEVPKRTSHKEMAEIIIEKLKQKPDIKAGLKKLSRKL